MLFPLTAAVYSSCFAPLTEEIYGQAKKRGEGKYRRLFSAFLREILRKASTARNIFVKKKENY